MIFFDIDNTLVDYSASEKGAIKFIMERYSLNIEDYSKIWKGLSGKYFSEYLANNLSFEEQGAMRILDFFKMEGKVLSFEEAKIIFGEYRKKLEESWELFDDVKPCLENLNNIEKGIASNGKMSQQQNKIRTTGIEKYFTVKRYASEMKTAKPDYAFFEKLKADCNNNAYLYIGDELTTDIYPCIDLRIRAIWLNRDHHEVPPDVTSINGLNELPKLLSSFDD